MYSEGRRQREYRGLADLQYSRDSYTIEEPSHKGELEDAATLDIRDDCYLVGGRDVERTDGALVPIKK